MNKQNRNRLIDIENQRKQKLTHRCREQTKVAKWKGNWRAG